MKPIALLTLNVERFHNFDTISDYIGKTQPDIINLQEASTGLWQHPVQNQDFLEKIAKKYNYHLVYHPFASIQGDDAISQWVATLSRFPVIDYYLGYFHNQHHEVYWSDHPWFDSPNTREGKIEAYPHAFTTPHGFLSCVLDTPQGHLRIINTHLHVSFLCTDTQQLIEEARTIRTYIRHSKSLPTILSGDLNIRYDSATCRQLIDTLTCHTTHLTNTLDTEVHPIWKNEPDHPGLAIDHIWSNEQVLVQDIDFAPHGLSDHRGVICTLNIQ